MSLHEWIGSIDKIKFQYDVHQLIEKPIVICLLFYKKGSIILN